MGTHTSGVVLDEEASLVVMAEHTAAGAWPGGNETLRDVLWLFSEAEHLKGENSKSSL